MMPPHPFGAPCFQLSAAIGAYDLKMPSRKPSSAASRSVNSEHIEEMKEKVVVISDGKRSTHPWFNPMILS
jgi:hypothetical protein